MTYEEAVAFWHGHIDFERRQPKAGDLKLDRMRTLLHRLDDPHARLKIVHVAGTKGKGSSAAMLASVLREAGLRGGLFTSPHLTDLSERIQVNGIPISRDDIARHMGSVASAVREMERDGDPNQTPTFFEIITALGFLHFLAARVDLVVLEVGLGGRFDSTNVCEPLLSIITNISFDHMALLGRTLGEIAYQKAGIIKPGVPVISTAEHPEAREVIEAVAREQGSRLRLIDRDFRWSRLASEPFTPGPVRVITDTRDWGWLPVGLFGEHQGANAAGVVAAIEELRYAGLNIPDQAVRAGLARVDWPGRMELLSRRPVVVLDCAHNVASARALVETLQSSFPIPGRKHLLFAASTDKQILEMLEVLVPLFDAFHLTRYQSNPRSADPEKIREMVNQLGGRSVQVYSSPEEAWRRLREELSPDDGVVVAGSVFLAGEMRPMLLRDERS